MRKSHTCTRPNHSSQFLSADLYECVRLFIRAEYDRASLRLIIHQRLSSIRLKMPKWLYLGPGFTFAIVYMTMQVYSHRLYFTHPTVNFNKAFSISSCHCHRCLSHLYKFKTVSMYIYIYVLCMFGARARLASREFRTNVRLYVLLFFLLLVCVCARSSFQPILLCEVPIVICRKIKHMQI